MRGVLARAPRIGVASPGLAASGADAVFLATPFQAAEAVLTPLKAALRGKVLIDCTNPVGAGLKHGLDSRQSGTEFIQSLLPDTKVVKAFSIYGYENLEDSSSGGGFTRVQRYFDQKTLYEQIGMQVIIEPLSQGKAFYGYSKRVPSGNPAVPAVMAMTWIRFQNQSELDHIRTHSAKIIQDFLKEPGFISIVTGASGDRAFTDEPPKAGFPRGFLSRRADAPVV